MIEGEVDIFLKFVRVEPILLKQLLLTPEKMEVVHEVYSFYIAGFLQPCVEPKQTRKPVCYSCWEWSSDECLNFHSFKYFKKLIEILLKEF